MARNVIYRMLIPFFFLFLLCFPLFYASANEELETDIVTISEGSDLLRSGYFVDGNDTIWLLFDNNRVVVIAADNFLPDISASNQYPWNSLAPNASIYILTTHSQMVSGPDACSHNYIATTLSEATLTSNGETLYTCCNCGKHYTVTTYYQDEEVHYYLTAMIDGQEVILEITDANKDAISILVGVDYSLVKLSKKSKPVTKIRVSSILKMVLKPKSTIKKYNSAPASSDVWKDPGYVREELCTLTATQAGICALNLENESSATTLYLKAVNDVAAGDKTGSESASDDKTGSETAADDKTESESASDDKTGSESAADDKTGSEAASDDKTESESASDDKTGSEAETESAAPIPQKSLAVGKTFSYQKATYKVTKKDQTVRLISINKKYSSSSFTIPSKVTHNGVSYKVNAIGANAFAGCKLRTLKINTSLLKSSTVSSTAFKALKKQKALTVKVPKKMLKSYKALLKKRGLPSSTKYVGF